MSQDLLVMCIDFFTRLQNITEVVATHRTYYFLVNANNYESP